MALKCLTIRPVLCGQTNRPRAGFPHNRRNAAARAIANAIALTTAQILALAIRIALAMAVAMSIAAAGKRQQGPVVPQGTRTQSVLACKMAGVCGQGGGICRMEVCRK